VRVELAEPPEDKVRLELLNEITGGLLVAGEILSVSATVPLKPFRLVTVIVELALAPGCTVIEAGFAPIEKSGCAACTTETWMLVECDMVPLNPVTVTV
jgi:hypothetical protein